MARADLSKLLANREEPTTPTETPAPPSTTVAEQQVAPQRAPRATQRREPASAGTRPTDRKGAVLYADQLLALDIAAKRLNKAKTVPGPRITANTLLRVAADLLLQHEGDLRGNDENEIRAALGLERTALDGSA